MNELEKYIDQHQREFDEVESPEFPDEIWGRIKDEIPMMIRQPISKRVISILGNRYFQWGIAASFGLLIGLSTWLIFPYGAYLDLNEPSARLAQFAPQYADREQDYLHQIDLKMTALNFQEINQQEYQDIFRELNALDELYEDYMEDIKNAIGNEQFIQTIIRFYERKINLLERLSLEIRKKQRNERIQKI